MSEATTVYSCGHKTDDAGPFCPLECRGSRIETMTEQKTAQPAPIEGDMGNTLRERLDERLRESLSTILVTDAECDSFTLSHYDRAVLTEAITEEPRP